MAENLYNLDEFNMSEEELFSPVDRDGLESERITAPRYSYWKSVFRVFFRKKINIIVLSLLAVLAGRRSQVYDAVYYLSGILIVTVLLYILFLAVYGMYRKRKRA